MKMIPKYLKRQDDLHSLFWLVILALIITFLTNCAPAKYQETKQQPFSPNARLAPTPPGTVAPQIAPVAAAPRIVPVSGTRAAGGAPIGGITGDASNDRDETIHIQTSSTGFSDTPTSTAPPVPTSTQPIVINGSGGGTSLPPSSACSPCSANLPPPPPVPNAQPAGNCPTGNCYKATMVQKNEVTSMQPYPNVDIVLVIDPKSTMQPNRDLIVTQIGRLFSVLPTFVDYNVIVLNTDDSHGPQTSFDMDFRQADRRFEDVQKQVAAQVAKIQPLNYAGTSEMMMGRLSSLINNAGAGQGPLRAGAGLFIAFISDERGSNLTMNKISATAGAKAIYDNIENLLYRRNSDQSVATHKDVILQAPFTVVSLTLSDSTPARNNNGEYLVSESLMLNHFANGARFDITNIDANSVTKYLQKASEKAESGLWLKKGFRVLSQKSADPQNVCVVVNGEKLVPTNFISETGEIRLDPTTIDNINYHGSFKTSTGKIVDKMAVDVIWCEDGVTSNVQKTNTFSINTGCYDRYKTVYKKAYSGQ